MRGLEPPRPYGHTDLNRARLPIPPHPRGRPILARVVSLPDDATRAARRGRVAVLLAADGPPMPVAERPRRSSRSSARRRSRARRALAQRSRGSNGRSARAPRSALPTPRSAGGTGSSRTASPSRSRHPRSHARARFPACGTSWPAAATRRSCRRHHSRSAHPRSGGRRSTPPAKAQDRDHRRRHRPRHPFFDPAGYAMPAGFPKGHSASRPRR